MTATSRSRVLVGPIGRTRCNERQPSKICSVPGKNSAVAMLGAAVGAVVVGGRVLLLLSAPFGVTLYLDPVSRMSHSWMGHA